MTRQTPEEKRKARRLRRAQKAAQRINVIAPKIAAEIEARKQWAPKKIVLPRREPAWFRPDVD